MIVTNNDAVLAFKRYFGNEAEYQNVLDICGNENKDWTEWLMFQGFVKVSEKIQNLKILYSIFIRR